MTEHVQYLTALVLVATAVLLILYDIWAIWHGGSEATESWLLLTWWTAHPVVMFGIFILIGHLFFPTCAPPNGMVVGSPLPGSVLGVVAVAVIIYEVFEVWMAKPSINLRYNRWFFARLSVLALAGIAVGHALFTQYLPCG